MRYQQKIMAAICIAGLAALAAGDDVQALAGPGDGGSIAYDINDQGTIVGTSSDRSVLHATTWDSAGTGSFLGAADEYDSSVANAINNNGLIVGYSELGSNGFRTATSWDGGRINDLGADMRASGSTFASGLNDNGTIVGGGAINPGFGKGWVWTGSTGGQVAGTLYQLGSNRAINNMDIIVGHSAFFGDPDRIHVSMPDGRGGYITEDIAPPGFNFSIGTAVNNNGMIVGHTNYGTDGAWQAAIFASDLSGPPGPPMLLGSLDGLNTSEANDVNDNGMIVGYSWDGTHSGLDSRAWAYNNGTMFDLNDMLDSNSSFALLIEATGVNSDGDIVGYGLLHDGTTSAFLIEGFVPAPGTTALLALGSMAIGRRRRTGC